MRRSKIDLMDWLRSCDVWQDASLWKEERKNQLRAEGRSRREANQMAWSEMEELFNEDSVRRHSLLQFAVMAQLPPRLDANVVDQEGEPRFDVIWRLWCLCLGRLECWEAQDFETATIFTRQICQKTGGEQAELITLAASKAREFVKLYVAPKFVKILSRLEKYHTLSDVYSEELQCHIGQMERFGVRDANPGRS